MKHLTYRQEKKASSLWSGLGGRLMFCGILVLLAALLAAADGLLRERAAQAAAQQALEQLRQQALAQECIGSTSAAAGPGLQPSAASGTTSVVPPDAAFAAQSPGDVPAPQFYGILQLPTLGLELPVAQDCTPAQLDRCPCRFSGETDGALVIAGHDFRRHFGGLHRLAPGDEVTFVDQAGQEHHYHMALSEVLPPDGGALLAQGDWPLTLLTCTRGGSERLVVRLLKG